MLSRLASLIKKATPYVPIIFFAFVKAAFAQPQFVQGATNFLDDATTWLLGLIPSASGLAIGYHAIMKQFAEDPSAASIHNRAMRNVLVAGAIGESAVAITKAFLAYFQ